MAKIFTTKNGFTMVNGATACCVENVLEEESFKHVLYRERKRVERSGESMLLLLLDLSRIEEGVDRSEVLALLSGPLPLSIRDTDACGWLQTGELLGIVFTEIHHDALEQARLTVEHKVRESLLGKLSPAQYKRIGLSILAFPEKPAENEDAEQRIRFNPFFYPEVFQKDMSSRIAEGAKRAMDLVGSSLALLLFSPLLVIMAVLVKTTSHGPVLYRQTRLGQFGKPFTFLKFRSMHVNRDDSIHREFIKGFISNCMVREPDPETGEVVFKIRHDPRLTPIGSFMRKSSIDELPQFFNVLRGEMSLVGPRPPIPYEVAEYDVWHLNRILARKPGITGLWQISKRSLATFDAMVRLDLQYIRTWSLWLDIKILLATPRAVLRGKGAY
jgi:lipopolysaccharide/colanic/teichoic acid biosynthesis glycosyltransferase